MTAGEIIAAVDALRPNQYEAAQKLADALHYFDHCNEAMAEALELAKGE